MALSKSRPYDFLNGTTLIAGLSAFGLYTCIYAFRKTFAAATFEGESLLGVDYKIWLVIAQVFGYAVSKFAGIQIISELRPESRAHAIILATAAAGTSWLLFAVIPYPYNILCLFLNGFALGLTWGMVYSYLEGRRATDFLGAALAVSFIFSSGLCKSAGGLILQWGVSDRWMPLVGACLFLPLLLFFLHLLEQVPPPSESDTKMRSRREPMNFTQRKEFALRFQPGLILAILFYVMLTGFRDFRDNFASDIWAQLGVTNPMMFTLTEIPVTLICLVLMGSLVFIVRNDAAFHTMHYYMIGGMVILGGATYAFQAGVIPATWWMTGIGLGLYLGYLPFNCAYFDRLLSLFKVTGTTGFAMYLADAFGYLGSCFVLLAKQFFQPSVSWVQFGIGAGYTVSVSGIFLSIAALVYFDRKYKNEATGAPAYPGGKPI